MTKELETFTAGYNGHVRSLGDSSKNIYVAYNDDMTGMVCYVPENTVIAWEEDGGYGKTHYRSKKLTRKNTPIYKLTDDQWFKECENNSDFHHHIKLEDGTVIASKLDDSIGLYYAV